MRTTILTLLWLWHTQHHMTQHRLLRVFESLHPNLVPFYSHSERLSWWHLKLCVGSACIRAWNGFPLSVRAEKAVQPRHRFQREMEEEMKRQEGGSECTIRMQSVALFSAFFLLACWQSVWDPVWSASMRSLQSPSTDACMNSGRDEERRYYQVEQVSINQPGKNKNKHKNLPSLCCCTYSTWAELSRHNSAHCLCLS